jgi:class 3 adenylate cyclase/predicted ATPase
MPNPPATKEQLERAISDLEERRELLGNAIVDPAIAALREQLVRVSAPAHTAVGDEERKIVTVMFADLSGFTRLAENLGAEEARELVNACFERLVPVIQRYDGTIDKFLGDAIMVLFGAPAAHENDPERALRTALELIVALKSFNADRKLALSLHIGINTGPVIAGTVGAQTRQDYSVMGDTVNVAARLEDACGNDEILVGPETFRQTASLFEFVALPPLQLKGKSEPLVVYRLAGLQKFARAGKESVSSRTALVGREAELAQIKGAIDHLHSGKGSVLCITGEAGIGKSRLVSEARVLCDKAVWAETRALSYTEMTSYRMARDLLHSLLGTSSDEKPSAIQSCLHRTISETAANDFSKLYPYLARALEIPLDEASSDEIEFLTAEILQRRTLEAFQAYVERRAANHPVVLVWEDVHWADPSSLQVLELFASTVTKVPLLVMIAYRRETAVRDRMNEMLARLPTDRVAMIELAPLTRQESTSFIAAFGKISNAEAEQALLNRAEGNPLFLEELLRSITDPRVKTVHDISDVPETLQAVLAARVDSLPREWKRVLQRAAVIGRTFHRKILAHVCQQQGENSATLNQTLQELRRQSFVRFEQAQGSPSTSSEEEIYAFQHAITHEVVYHSLLQATCRHWHYLTGEAMEQLFPQRLDELSGILGRHFEQAGAHQKAIDYLTRAALRARTIFSNSEAIAFYRSALAQVNKASADPASTYQPESSLTIQLHEGLGDVLELNGEIEAARDQFDQARSLVTGDDGITRSRLHRKCGSTWVLRRDYDKTFEKFRQAEQELESEKSTCSEDWWNEWAQIQLERMHLFYWLGMSAELNALASNIRARMEEHGTSAQHGRFFAMLALSSLSEHRYVPPKAAVEYAQRALTAAKGSDNPTELGHLKFTLGFVQLWRGNLEISIHYLSNALQLSEKVGDIVLQVRCLTYLAVAYRRIGQTSNAESFAQRARSISTRLELVQYVAMADATLAWIAWHNGDSSEVRARALQALEQWHSMPDPYGFDWMALWPLIAVEHAEKNFAAATDHLRALSGPNQHPLPALLTSIVQAAIEASEKSSPDIPERISAALTAAREAGQL